MPLQPSAWEAARASISSALKTSYLHPEEVSVGRRYADDLEEAIRRHSVGADHFHEQLDPKTLNWSQITTTDEASAFARFGHQALNAHFRSHAAHWRAALLEIQSIVDVNLLLNAMKMAFNSHRTMPGVHFNDDTMNVVSAPDATDDASQVALAEALRGAASRHLSNYGTIVIEVKQSDRAQYDEQVRRIQERVTQALKTVAYAERVARAAQVSLGYTYSGAGQPWEKTPFSRLEPTLENAPKIRDRLSNISEAGTYNDDSYFRDVVVRASALISNIGPVGHLPPPGQNVIVVIGTISSTAESALNAAISKVNRFAAAAAVQ